MDRRDESDLIRRCVAGDAAAYAPLVRRHEARAHAVARGLLGDADEAEDAVQDAFVRAYRTLGRLAEGSAFGPWFATILRNLCLDRLRSPRRRETRLDDAALERGLARAAGGAGEVERRELAREVRAALEALTPEHRSVLVMKELEGLRYAEIAGALGISAGTVASRLHHARSALRAVLEARGIGTEDLPQ